MTRGELVAWMRSRYATVCEWGKTVRAEVFDNGWSYADPVSRNHCVLNDSIQSYLGTLDRFLVGYTQEDPAEPCNPTHEEIVMRGFSNLERQYRARPKLYKKAKPIPSLW